MNRTTTISWGTVLSGLIALATQCSSPSTTSTTSPSRGVPAGPGAVITIGVLFLSRDSSSSARGGSNQVPLRVS